MTRHRLGWLIFLAPFTVAHAADEPAWLTKARAAEATPMAPVDIRSPDGELTARVPAKLAGPITKDDAEYLLQFDVGPDVVVNCELLFDGFDSASLLRSTATMTFDEVSKSYAKVETSVVEGLDVGAWGTYPYLSVRWLYRAAAEGGAQLGGLKQVAVDLHDHGLYCAVVDLGYEQTLLSITRSLVETLELKGRSQPQPKYLDISTISLGTTKIGWSVNEISVDADGDLRTIAKSAMLAPAAQGGATAGDTVLVEWTDAKGAMLNAAYVSVANGSTEADLKLVSESEGQWRMSGTFKSKPLDTAIAGGPPSSTYAEALKRRTAMASPNPVGYQTTTTMWTSLDPTRFLEGRFRILERLPDGTFRAEDALGPVTATSVIDPTTGWPIKTSLPLGPQTMTIERIYQRGAP